MKEKEFVSIKEAAKELGVSRQVVYRLIKQGKLTVEPAHPLFEKHGPVKIPREQVLALKPQR